VTAQPPRREDRSHAQPRAGASSRRAWRAWRGPDWSGRAAAPKAGLNRHDLARPYTGPSAGELFQEGFRSVPHPGRSGPAGIVRVPLASRKRGSVPLRTLETAPGTRRARGPKPGGRYQCCRIRAVRRSWQARSSTNQTSPSCRRRFWHEPSGRCLSTATVMGSHAMTGALMKPLNIWLGFLNYKKIHISRA
jgi:hypothetical protein